MPSASDLGTSSRVRSSLLSAPAWPPAVCVCVYVSGGFLSVFLTYGMRGKEERDQNILACLALLRGYSGTLCIETEAQAIWLLSFLPVEDSGGIECWLFLSCSTFVCVLETCPLTPHKCPLTVSFRWVTAALSDAHDPPQPRCPLLPPASSCWSPLGPPGGPLGQDLRQPQAAVFLLGPREPWCTLGFSKA